MKKILLTLIAVCLAGCSVNTAKDRLEVPMLLDGQPVIATYESELTQVLFLYFTKTKQIYRQNPISITTVGEIESFPDPNSVRAVAEGVIAGIKGI